MRPVQAALGIDGGGSSTRWLLLDPDGHPLGRGQAGPLSGHVLTEAGRAENLARLEAVLRDALHAAGPRGVGWVVAGVTGVQPGSVAARLFRAEAARCLALDEVCMTFDTDIAVAYRSRFSPGEGVLVYAGTGSVAYHLRANGEALRAGGHGYLIDDAGGGYWLGREALKTVLREADRLGHPPATPLAAAIYGALGHMDWPHIFEVVYGGGRSRVAALAPAVGQAAAAGDDTALALLRAAGRELAQLARAILGRLPAPVPIAFAGGVARLGPVLHGALQEGLPGGVTLTVADAEPVEAAARLALAALKTPG